MNIDAVLSLLNNFDVDLEAHVDRTGEPAQFCNRFGSHEDVRDRVEEIINAVSRLEK